MSAQSLKFISLLRNWRKRQGIIIISSEMPELLGITDRITVMSNGLVSGIVDTKTTTQNEILRLASLHL